VENEGRGKQRPYINVVFVGIAFIQSVATTKFDVGIRGHDKWCPYIKRGFVGVTACLTLAEGKSQLWN
jgi:hypothetical protein